MLGNVIELLIYHQPGVKPSLTLRPFGVLGYVAGHSLTDLIILLKFCKGQEVIPIILTFIDKQSDILFKFLVDALGLSVSLGMIGCRRNP